MKNKSESSYQLKHTAYWIFLSWCAPDLGHNPDKPDMYTPDNVEIDSL